MELPKIVKEALQAGVQLDLTKDMQDPRQVAITCEGSASKPHKPTIVAKVWVDLASGEYTTDGEDFTVITRNLQNFQHDRPLPYERQRSVREDPKHLADDPLYADLAGLEKDLHMSKSWEADTIYCHRCKTTVQVNSEDLRKLWMKTAEAGLQGVDLQMLARYSGRR